MLSTALLAWLRPGDVLAVPDQRNDKNIPEQYIQNRDTPGFFIRSANPFLGVDMATWSLAVTGKVKKPLTLSYEDLFGFKLIGQVSRLKCVECWSAKAQWEGFPFRQLVERVEPDAAAQFVHFHSADSYYESYALEELLRPRVMLVLRMNGSALTREHGYPLRLIAPFKYGYKSIKYITRIEFARERKRNYWADYGPYSVDGTIQPGIDHPLDFGKKPLPINGGEVFHPFDERPS
jgi:DMSO/TMAO reductase YedYZ molybdopterin-dependent catalytic subunit